jgi:hypothetical protein
MTTDCKIYSTEHVEALHRAQRALARLNLVSITMLEQLMCWMSTNEMILDTMELMYTMSDHRRLLPMPAGEAPMEAKS